MNPEETRTASAAIILSTSFGLLLSFVSGVIRSSSNVILKYLANISPCQLAVYRFFVNASCSLPHLIFAREDVAGPPAHRTSIAVLAIIGPTSIILQFFAFRYLPLGEATVLTSCYPAFVTVAAKIFLKESLGLLHVISLMATIVGIFLTTNLYHTIIVNQRIYSIESIYGLSAALASLIFCTASLILMRKLRRIHYSVLMFGGSIVGIIEAVIVTALVTDFSLNCRGLQQILIILFGFLSYIAFLTSIVALKHAQAGPSTTIKAASDIFFSFVWQILIFGDVPAVITVIGAALICFSIILIGLSQRINALLPLKYLKLC